jgi:hypothetical protein
MAIKLKYVLKDFEHESLRALFYEIKKLTPGTYNVFLSNQRLIRSKKQNAYYWGVLIKTIIEYTGHDKEEMHEILKVAHNLKTFHKPGGGVIEYGGSTKLLNTKEFTVYIDKCRQWALNELAVYIPSPNEITDDMWVESYGED